MNSINHALNTKRLSYGKILIDIDSCMVTYDGIIIPLLPKEYKLLLLFLRYPNHILSHEVIINNLWEIDKFPTSASIRAHIKGLRKAFKKANAPEDIVETVHGMGYRLKPLKKDRSTNSIISPSVCVMESFLQAKAIEYVAINDKLIIQYISPGLPNYCDYPDALKIGAKAENAFPEFIGLEDIFEEVVNKKLNYFEIKGIARAANPNRPDYINLYVIADDTQRLNRVKDNLLFIFFEDYSEQMIYRQRLVQLENTHYLLLEIESDNKLNKM
ncbi:MAG TPA: response regulator transcription factor [Coleofasciculaceae cyanobacterium]